MNSGSLQPPWKSIYVIVKSNIDLIAYNKLSSSGVKYFGVKWEKGRSGGYPNDDSSMDRLDVPYQLIIAML